MGGAGMKLVVAMALALSLLALGCAKANLDNAASVSAGASAEGPRVPFVRIAELEIDPAQREAYKAAVKEEMETSVRVEPGVLAIYAVAEKDNPSKLRFFEMYADKAAYNAHIESAHFTKYV